MTAEALAETVSEKVAWQDFPFPNDIAVGVALGEIEHTDIPGKTLCGPGATVDFSPEPENKTTTKAAKEVCVKCAGKAACLGNALLNSDSIGVHGGFDTRERNKMLRVAKQIVATKQ